MATFEVAVGKHYHRMPPFSTLPWVGEQSIQRYVTFSPDCQYDSPAYNGEDVNKLFGLSFGFKGVHWNSARFGWRWSKADQCIELLAYCYVNGVRNWDEQLRFPVVKQVQLGEQVECKIEFIADIGSPQFRLSTYKPGGPLTGYVWIETVEQPYYGLTHGLYWGGELPCPHDIHVTINRHGS